jgi:hypothetical protein
MSIEIPAVGVTALADEIAAFGAQDLETGAFLLAPRASPSGRDPRVTVIALAGDAGIVRQRDLFQVSERALAQIFAFAGDRGLWIPALLHSHQGSAFLSPADQRHGLRADGFISAVIPAYSCPPRDLARWGWWQFEAGRWRDAAPGSVTGETAEVIRFDEAGIRGA